jgi:hypothetical protein
MGMHEGRGQLAKAYKTLILQWQEVKMNWDDKQARDFQERFLEPLENDIKQAASAMDQAAGLLNRIHQECE